MHTIADPNLDAARPLQQAKQAQQQRNAAVAVAGIAVVLLLLALLGGGILFLRSGSSTPVAAGGPIASSGSPSAAGPANGAASPGSVVPVTAPVEVTSTTASTTTGPVTTAAPSIPAPQPVPAPQPAPKPAPTTPPAPPTTSKPAAALPAITSFVTPENIDCHNGNFQQFSASFTTTNAVKATISIDGPGVYKTYGPNEAEIDLPFNCSSPHTFLLTAYNADGKTATRSITLQPRNVQVVSNDDDQ